jgi:hypothetical protein
MSVWGRRAAIEGAGSYTFFICVNRHGTAPSMDGRSLTTFWVTEFGNSDGQTRVDAPLRIAEGSILDREISRVIANKTGGSVCESNTRRK